MKPGIKLITASTLLMAAGLLQSATSATAEDAVVYTVTFTRAWTEKTHPFEYPKAGLLTGPHFSGLIGATHGDGYVLFAEGTAPTPGLERLSEEGKHSPLDDEIEAAIKAGKAGALFETGPIRDALKTETATVRVTAKYPMVSAVAMIAPSPDWFAGVANVDLRKGDDWVQTKTVELYPWDSGGDDGTTYEASDKDTNPKKPTSKASTPHFVTGGSTPAVGTLTFTLQK